MDKLTLTGLNRIANSCDGVEIEITEQDLDTSFLELDVDSLALVELAERAAESCGVPVPAEVFEDFRTPRLALEYVRRHAGGGEE
ncbi:phosphopantetheine binding protein [Haloactinospora alba]|uniref:Phosphopantetheine binding protein n=1 Tax=Haloactinospora alba TaxID=405555 RepID=A0A543NNW6_9ACTN|nr:acyl carrier protein [Haloactinospora alba]TQN33466.1 phosphopantetheine binding protein [Haloactinospora alba]